MVTGIFLAMALHTTMPAENYNSWFSPEIASVVADATVNGEYYQHLDFNGDGVLNAVDTFSIYKRYTENETYGNELTVDEDTIYSIVEENYNLDDVVEWELMGYDNKFSEMSNVDLLVRMDDGSAEMLTLVINPIEERITVVENGRDN